MEAKIRALLAIAVLGGPLTAAAEAITWDLTASAKCIFSLGPSGAVCNADGTFAPQSFSLTTEISSVFAVGPTITTYSDGSGYGYTQAEAFRILAIGPSFSLADSPFTAELDSYLSYAGALAESLSGSGTDSFVDYSLGFADMGSTSIALVATRSGGSCTPDCSGGYSYSGYSQYLFLNASNATFNSALSDVTNLSLSDYLAILAAPDTHVSFTHIAVDYAYNSCAAPCSVSHTKYSGAQYTGYGTASLREVPEPTTLGLLGVGLTASLVGRRRLAVQSARS